MNFFEFAENLQNYSASDLLDDLQTELEGNPYAKALQLQQWNLGEDSEGRILGIYTKTTEILSGGRKKAGETYDIFDTGVTRRNTNLFGLQVNGDIDFWFDSESPAMAGLMEKIGDRMFGLQDKNLGQLAEIAQDVAVDLLNINLNLK